MKILVIGPSWVGDMMMSQSLYRTLKAEHPDAVIDVMAPAWCRPLLSRMPEVNQALAMPLGHGALALGERHRLGNPFRPAAMIVLMCCRIRSSLLWCRFLQVSSVASVGVARCAMAC